MRVTAAALQRPDGSTLDEPSRPQDHPAARSTQPAPSQPTWRSTLDEAIAAITPWLDRWLAGKQFALRSSEPFNDFLPVCREDESLESHEPEGLARERLKACLSLRTFPLVFH